MPADFANDLVEGEEGNDADVVTFVVCSIFFVSFLFENILRVIFFPLFFVSSFLLIIL